MILASSTFRRLAPWAPALLLAMAGAVGAAVAAARPLDEREAAGIFPPWWSQEEALAAASRAGAVIAVGRAPFVIVVRAPEGDAAGRLRRAGALFSVDPMQARACGI
ncbi:hypothetical protein [Phenylobacterium sp.]|uniref:hypothetical protein n=1 Tax=Phenylobacterium sp. TaxID=1871053 RepID=UPI0028A14E86|nr:hypothetical protein [Phenylobacterium sp.]